MQIGKTDRNRQSVVNDQGQISATAAEEVFKSKPPAESNSSDLADDSILCHKKDKERLYLIHRFLLLIIVYCLD